MKTNRLYLILFCLVVMFAGCNDDIDDIKKRQDEMEKRLAELETWRESTNAQLVSLNGLVTAMQQNKLIKEMKPFPDGTGYKIIFEDGEEMIIKHGTDGKNGTSGTNGTAPIMGVEFEEATGKYYWTQKIGDAEPVRVKDAWGEDVEVTGGAKGEDGKTPQLGVDSDGYWVMIIDGIETRVTDASNQPVKAVSGGSVIWKVEEDADKVTFYLMSGDKIVINKSAAAPATVVAVLAVPDFTASYVYNIMLEGIKIGEICREYNAAISTTEAVVVVYSYKVDGKIYGKGLVMKDGGSVNHDGTEYTPGSTPATTITVKSNGGISINTDAVSGDASICVADKLKDVENNGYKIVKIGTLYWMAENLKTMKYNDGVALLTNQTQTDMAKGANATVDACVVQGGSLDANNAAYADNRAKFGLLYNGVAVKKDNGKLAPTGWHVATLADWNALKNSIVSGDADYEVSPSKNVVTKGMLKSSVDVADGGWTTAGSNPVGFSALTGGCWDTSFKSTDHRWWTGTPYDGTKLCSFVIFETNNVGAGTEGTGDLRKQYDNHGRCLAVRCVRD